MFCNSANSSIFPIDGITALDSLRIPVIAEYTSLISAGIQILNLEIKFSFMMCLFCSFFKVIEAMVSHYGAGNCRKEAIARKIRDKNRHAIYASF